MAEIKFNSKTTQAIKAFNLQVEKLLIKLKPVVLSTDEISENDYNDAEMLIRQFVIPGDPILFVHFFKVLIFDDYHNYIKNEDDSLFSIEAVMREYKNIFKKLRENGTKSGVYKIGEIIIKGLKKDKNKVENDLKKIENGEGEKLFLAKKKKIDGGIKKCRETWDSLDKQDKRDVWNSLKAMSVLIEKYIYN